MTSTETTQHIVTILQDIFREKGLTHPPLSSDTVLDQLGLESLDFAQAVIRMEEITGKDPFASEGDFQIRTLGDLCAMYD